VETVVLSDLHLGARTGVDVLRRPSPRSALLAELADGPRVVLLGDALELRHGPAREAVAAADPLLQELGEALGDRGQVVLVAGNHDHGLIAPWLERRLNVAAPEPLGLERWAEAGDVGGWVAEMATRLAPAELRVAYPGLWLREDVYATHGHYLDRHITVPTFERLGAGAMSRLLGSPAAAAAGPEDYEAVLAPLYAWGHALAQRSPGAAAAPGTGAATRLWRTLADGHGGALRAAMTAAGYAGAVGAVNRMGLGPLRRDLSAPELRRAGLVAMGEAVGRLSIDAEHVVFGHTHRAGPLAGDEHREWRAAGGARLHNAGSWVYERHFLTATPNESPYWPGVVVRVGPDGPPQLRRLLGDHDHAALAPP